MNYKSIFAVSILMSSIAATAQNVNFQGVPGIYILGQVDQSMPTSEYAKPFVSGTAVRTLWQSIEPSPGVFNWTFLDNEIAKAAANEKNISLLILGAPSWLADINTPMYAYIDNKPGSPTYHDTLYAPITWSDLYVSRLSGLIKQLGAKYSGNTTVKYVNCISGNMNNNLPSSVASGASFWAATGYHRDTLVEKMKEVLDVYMEAFPYTPCWNSLENIAFEMPASGNANNYVIAQYAKYGSETYPDRFGVWREDLSGCTSLSNPSGHWAVVASFPCRTGAQALWNVQDGPTRMNQCGLIPNTEAFVLQSAFNIGFSMNMRYFEVYKVDIDDTGLESTLQTAADSILTVNNLCTTSITGRPDLPENFIPVEAFPNPVHDLLQLDINDENATTWHLSLSNWAGMQLVIVRPVESQLTIDMSIYPPGAYWLRGNSDKGFFSQKIIKL